MKKMKKENEFSFGPSMKAAKEIATKKPTKPEEKKNKKPLFMKK